MRVLLNTIFSLCSVGMVLASLSISNDGSGTNGLSTRECISEANLDKTLFSLSQQYDEAQVAQNTLRESCSVSPECRLRIVVAMIKAMDKPSLDISTSESDANLWREGATLLGDLKATESLDLLLSHITMTDGSWSTTMTHQPALSGIIRMGSVAVPKLERLLRNKDWETRHSATFCLAYIGGPKAVRALQRARPMEQDSCLKRLMLISIKSIDIKRGGVKPDHGEWASAFLCMP